MPTQHQPSGGDAHLDKQRNKGIKPSLLIFVGALCCLLLFFSACEQNLSGEKDKETEPGQREEGASIQEETSLTEEEASPTIEDQADQGQLDHTYTRSLLEKSISITNLSYTARFDNENDTFIYQFYKRSNLTKTVIQDGETQSISVSDGKTTIYYSLPDKIGYTMVESGEDMGIVPSAEALMNEEVYQFKIMGEEIIFGYLCQVVETEDEFGVLKIWISKTMGLPIKYIGTDDNGWYSLELTEIQLGEPGEGIFAIPSDVTMMNMG